MDIILSCEPQSRWHEEQRSPSDITIWRKHCLRREIEHGSQRLIRRDISRPPPKNLVTAIGSPRLRPIKIVRQIGDSSGEEQTK